MLRFSAHFNYLFTEVPLAERFAAARECGFKGLEFPSPQLLGLERFRDLAAENGLTIVQISAPNTEDGPGRKGLACVPDQAAAFRETVERGLEAARVLNCPLLHVMAGIMPEGATRDELRGTYVSNMAHALRRCEAEGVTLMIEPISDESMPGYFLNHPALALEVLDELASPRATLMYDLYHAAVKGLDAVAFLGAHLGRIAHIQVADCPGRHEPGTGTVDFDGAFRLLERERYGGWIGCEYAPAKSSRESFGWRDAALRAVAQPA